MKTLILMACLLTISYAINPEVTKFKNFHAKCLEELNVQDAFPPNVNKCLLEKYELLDDQGLIMKEKTFKNLDKIIADKTKLRHVKEITNLCLEQANEGSESNDEKTMAVIKCASGTIYLFDNI